MQIRKSVADRIKENPAQGLPLLLTKSNAFLMNRGFLAGIRMLPNTFEIKPMQRQPWFCLKGRCDLWRNFVARKY
jgi:hypothetical protein